MRRLSICLVRICLYPRVHENTSKSNLNPSGFFYFRLHTAAVEDIPETYSNLEKKTDQTVEATHSKFDNFIRAHNYKIRDVESEKAGEYLLKAVKHFNSYNLGKID